MMGFAETSKRPAKPLASLSKKVVKKPAKKTIKKAVKKVGRQKRVLLSSLKVVRAGTKVRCINAAPNYELRAGRQYTVYNTVFNPRYDTLISLKSPTGMFFAYRFELVKE